MTTLRRCSPEIERELHDKEDRIRELEVALHETRHALILWTDDPNGDRREDAIQTADRVLYPDPPPDSEPAEEETWDYGVLEALDDLDDLVKFALESPRFCVDNPSSIRNPHRLADNIRGALQRFHALSEPAGEVVVTTNERGDAVAVTRQNEEGEILSVIWERDGEPAVPEAVRIALAQKEWITECARHEKSKFGEWQCNWHEAMEEADKEIDRALAQSEQGRVPAGWRDKLWAIHSALDAALGDSDVDWIESDEELRDEEPVQWAAKELSGLLAAAPQPQEDESDAD